jgi:hypothetical protein
LFIWVCENTRSGVGGEYMTENEGNRIRAGYKEGRPWVDAIWRRSVDGVESILVEAPTEWPEAVCATP